MEAGFSTRLRQWGCRLGLLLLASQLFQVGLDSIPPVTLAVLGLIIYLHLFPAAPLMQASMSVEQVYWHGDWLRLLLSPLHHLNDWHLYFNMVSFLGSGVNLERRLGGAWLLYLLSVFTVLTGLVYLVLEAGLTKITRDQSYSRRSVVGFSGVLFALTVLTDHYHPGGVTSVMGIHVSNRYAIWVELVLIQLIVPRASFIGHLAGILVGLLYTTGPLRKIMKAFAGFMTFNEYYSQPSTDFYSSVCVCVCMLGCMFVGYRGFHFHFSEEEEVNREEIRRRRLMRFDRKIPHEQRYSRRTSVQEGAVLHENNLLHRAEDKQQLQKERLNSKDKPVAASSSHPCPHCTKICGSRIGLYSHLRTHR
ncbi:rhomboid-related protein 4-like [Myripristis murdjan]|uniref:rhomboid-related protein 4-like n=1 Tax=Myripristis murdjan TaxID=586833 RepID=UPI00117634C0|nr:rhomboid-related protein 4-like [Myripristis murdjan]XP_029923548.1 rhomboid-related protein 4-like [Myripristis murdjan]